MSLFNVGKKAWLMLENGRVYEGYSFGKEGTVFGELVFTTAMTGYQETLTDPSYYGQIVTQTFPLIGNYGVNGEDFESDFAKASGYVVREWCNVPSNFRCEGNIDEFMKSQNVVGIHSVDTRSITRTIREAGVMNAVITTEDVNLKKDELLEKIKAYKITKAVEAVTGKEIKEFPADGGKYSVVLWDFGYKHNIVKKLNSVGCNVTVVPAGTSAEEIAALKPDGVMLSNGPGNPADNTEIIENIKKLMDYKIPIFAICLGHQLLALANGGKTEKMKYGHRGANQPVIDLEIGRTFVTYQNHGYTVSDGSISPEIGEVSHKNANDGGCEGILYRNYPAFSVQFHPEADGGQQDTSYLYESFKSLMSKNKEDK